MLFSRVKPDREPPYRRPREGISTVIVNIEKHEKDSKLQPHEAVRLYDHQGEESGPSVGENKVDGVQMLSGEDCVMAVLMVNLVESVQSAVGVQQSVRPVIAELLK